MGAFRIKGRWLIKYNGKESDISIPSNITDIGNRAFYNC